MILNYLMTSGSVKMDSYGDIVLVNDDIPLLKDKNQIVIQNIVHHLRTQFKDYMYNPNLGTYIYSMIGEPIEKTTPSTIKEILLSEIKQLRIVDMNAIEIIAVRDGLNSIHVRIVLFDDDDLTIKVDLDNSNGVSIGY